MGVETRKLLPLSPVESRIVVVGTSCSGKSTLARRLAAVTGFPHIELDVLHWRPDWVEAPDSEMREAVREAVSGRSWVVDGNYGMVRDLVWPRATTLLWLNYSFPLVLSRALRRTVVRAATREPLFHGCRESFRRSFLSRESILLWVIRTYRERRRRYRGIVESGEYPHLAVREFRSPRETEDFLWTEAGRVRPGSTA